MEARAATDHKTWEGSWLPGPCPLGNSNLASQPVQVADVGRVQVEVDQVEIDKDFAAIRKRKISRDQRRPGERASLCGQRSRNSSFLDPDPSHKKSLSTFIASRLCLGLVFCSVCTVPSLHPDRARVSRLGPSHINPDTQALTVALAKQISPPLALTKWIASSLDLNLIDVPCI